LEESFYFLGGRGKGGRACVSRNGHLLSNLFAKKEREEKKTLQVKGPGEDVSGGREIWKKSLLRCGGKKRRKTSPPHGEKKEDRHRPTSFQVERVGNGPSPFSSAGSPPGGGKGLLLQEIFSRKEAGRGGNFSPLLAGGRRKVYTLEGKGWSPLRRGSFPFFNGNESWIWGEESDEP